MLIFTSGTSGDPKAVQVAAHDGAVRRSRSGRTILDHTRRRLLSVDAAVPLQRHAGRLGGRAGRRSGHGAGDVLGVGLLDDLRRYGATYMNYVGKPLAYVLATAEQPDDALRAGIMMVCSCFGKVKRGTDLFICLFFRLSVCRVPETRWPPSHFCLNCFHESTAAR